jgi:hypothetical protein
VRVRTYVVVRCEPLRQTSTSPITAGHIFPGQIMGVASMRLALSTSDATRALNRGQAIALLRGNAHSGRSSSECETHSGMSLSTRELSSITAIRAPVLRSFWRVET